MARFCTTTSRPRRSSTCSCAARRARQDLSRRLLEQLEREALERGYATCRLETGIRQPEAMALYRSAGYEEMECFGAYRDAPLSRCFERRLAAAE